MRKYLAGVSHYDGGSVAQLTVGGPFDSMPPLMIVIRLQRVGRKNDPSFRVVIMDSRKSAKSGKVIEIVGSYDARKKQKPALKGERISYWLSQGGKASDTVHNLLVDAKIITGKKVNALNKKSPIKKVEEKKEESAAPAPVEEVAPVVEAPAPVAEVV